METVRYGPIGREDVRLEPRNGTFEVRLADGSVVTMNALDVAHLISDAYLASQVPSNLPTGLFYRLKDSIRGLWGIGQNSAKFPLNGGSVNVKEFGARGDGATDDTEAFQAANDAAAVQGSTVVVPPGRYLVRQINVSPGVSWKGAGWTFLIPGGEPVGTVIQGTTGYNLFVFPTNGFFQRFLFEDLVVRGGKNQFFIPDDALGDGSTGINYLTVHRCLLGNATEAIFRIQRHTEHMYVSECELRESQYGLYTEDTVGFFDKNVFEKCRFITFTKNCVRLLCTFSHTTNFNNCTFISAAEHGFYADGAFQGLIIENCNTETNGTSGKSNRTTGTINAASDQLTVASTAGWQVGDIATVEGAGTTGIDLHSEVDAIVGSVLTLQDNAATSVTDARVTNAVWDDFHFENSLATPAQIEFIGGTLGGEVPGLGHLRYSIDASKVLTLHIWGSTMAGVGFPNIPVYDPLWRVGGKPGTIFSIRRPESLLTILGVGGSYFATSVPVAEEERTLIVSPAGKHVDVLLVDDDRTGTGGGQGSFGVRKLDPNRTRIFRVDGDTQLTHVGVFGHGIKGVFNFTPVVLGPTVVAANTTVEAVFAVPNLPFPSIVAVNPPAHSASFQAGTAVVGARVTAFEELTLQFVNTTAGNLNAGGGSYSILCVEF